MARSFGLTSRPTGPQVEHNVIQFKSAGATPALGQTTRESNPEDFINVWGPDFKARPLLRQAVIDFITILAWLLLGILFAFGVGSVVFIMGFLIFFG